MTEASSLPLPLRALILSLPTTTHSCRFVCLCVYFWLKGARSTGGHVEGRPRKRRCPLLSRQVRDRQTDTQREGERGGGGWREACGL